MGDNTKGEGPPLDPLSVRRKLYPHLQEQATLSWFILHVYNLPQATLQPLSVLASLQAASYYQQSLGAPRAYLVCSLALARGLDLLLSPAIASASDCLRSYYGRRRPLILLGLAPYILFSVLLFSPPTQLGSADMGTWFGLTFVGFTLCTSVVSIPYDALGAELADSTAQRTELYAAGSVYKYLGSAALFLVSAFMPDAIHFSPGLAPNPLPSSSTYLYTALLASFWLFWAALAAVYWGRERAQLGGVFALLPCPGLGASLPRLLRRPFASLLAPWALDACSYLLPVHGLQFAVRHLVALPSSCSSSSSSSSSSASSSAASSPSVYLCQPEAVTGLLLMSMSLSACVASAAWRAAAHRFGLKLSWVAQSACVALGLTGLAACLGSGAASVSAVVAMCALVGAGHGGGFLHDCLVCEAIEYDEFLTGQRCEGLLFMARSLLPKTLTIACAVLPVCSLYSLGYAPSSLSALSSPTPAPLPAAPALYILFFSSVLPAALAAASCAAKLSYPLRTSLHALVVAEGVGLHLQHRPAMCPLTATDYVLPPCLSLPGPPLLQAQALDNFPSYAHASDLLATTSVGHALSTLRHFVECARDGAALAFMTACGLLVGAALTFGLLGDAALGCVPLLFIVFLCLALGVAGVWGLRLGAALGMMRGAAEGGLPSASTVRAVMSQRRHADSVQRGGPIQVLEDTAARRLLRRHRLAAVAPEEQRGGEEGEGGTAAGGAKSPGGQEEEEDEEEEEGEEGEEGGGVPDHWRRLLHPSPERSLASAGDAAEGKGPEGAAWEEAGGDDGGWFGEAMLEGPEGREGAEGRSGAPTALELEMWCFLKEQGEINAGKREPYLTARGRRQREAT